MLKNQIRHLRLLDCQIGLRLEDLAHLQAVGLLIALGARGPDGWAARRIQEAELDADCIRDFSHDSAEGVDFADQVALGDSADCWIARHLGDQVDVERVEGGLQPHAGGGHGGFASGMSGADHDYVELFGELHGCALIRTIPNAGRLGWAS